MKTSLLRKAVFSKKTLLLILLILSALFIRFYFFNQFFQKSGDLLLFADWGEKYWEYGSKDVYFGKLWQYSSPNYPPISVLHYAFSNWLYQNRYVLAQIHNSTKLIPSAFIVYFGKYGYHLLLVLPAMIADLTLGLLIRKLTIKFTKSETKGLLAMLFFLFNPVSIFLSSVWGASDSMVALFAISAFLLVKMKPEISLPLYFISLYIKPNWALFLPLFSYFLYLVKPRLSKLLLGGLVSLVIFILVTIPFSASGIIDFTVWLFGKKLIPTTGLAQKASVSAFNIFTIFYKIDIDSNKLKVLWTSLDMWGFILFSIVNLISFNFIKKNKASDKSLITVLFTVGFSGYLFLTNMLERYFFPAFIPMIILIFTDLKLLFFGLLINVSVFANLLFSFFRRSSDEIGRPFVNDNYLLVKILSTVNLAGWVWIIYKSDILKTISLKFRK